MIITVVTALAFGKLFSNPGINVDKLPCQPTILNGMIAGSIVSVFNGIRSMNLSREVGSGRFLGAMSVLVAAGVAKVYFEGYS